jgi:coenzyme F420 hydrogenase subunit delta
MDREFRDIPEHCRVRTLILGCGNVLFGDDGFGPEVANYLNQHYSIPEDTLVMDAGTGVREILFDLLLSESRPEKVILIDAVDKGRKPGEFFTLELSDLPEVKRDDFSLHLVPSSNLLRELAEKGGMDIALWVCQVQRIPDEVHPGLSSPLAAAVSKASQKIYNLYIESK